MAIQPDEALEEGGEGIIAPEEGAEAAIVETPEEEGGEPPEDDPVSKLAMDMGWVPQEKYKGDPGKWKPADQFIRDGRDIQREQARDIRELKSTMETVAKTSAQILADRIETEKARLAEQYNAAVDEGDAKRAFEIGQKFHKLDEQQPVNSGLPPEAREFAQKHSAWFGVDPLATNLAQSVAEQYARAGRGVGDQLDAAEREVRRAYPHLFPQAKAPPGVATPSRAAPSNRGPKGAKDLPGPARKVAQDMVDRGLIPSLDVYATNYFKQEQAR